MYLSFLFDKFGVLIPSEVWIKNQRLFSNKSMILSFLRLNRYILLVDSLCIYLFVYFLNSTVE